MGSFDQTTYRRTILRLQAPNLEEEAPPFDVEAGAARLREAARARGLLSSGASENSPERATRRFRVGEVPPPAEGYTDSPDLLRHRGHSRPGFDGGAGAGLGLCRGPVGLAWRMR